MVLITDEQERYKYSEFMTQVCIAVYGAVEGNIEDILKMNPKAEASDSAEEIALASGQIVLDRILELSKDVPKELLIKYFAQAAAENCVDNMNKKPHLRMMVMFAHKLMKQGK